MKVNGIDIRKYDAKQLTVDVQPPGINVNYEWRIRYGCNNGAFKTVSIF